MRIRLTFDDNESFTAEEAKAINRNIYGKNCITEVLPDSNFPEAHIRYGIQQIIVPDIIDLWYSHEDAVYGIKLHGIKLDILDTIGETVERIISDTEKKLSE